MCSPAMFCVVGVRASGERVTIWGGPSQEIGERLVRLMTVSSSYQEVVIEPAGQGQEPLEPLAGKRARRGRAGL